MGYYTYFDLTINGDKKQILDAVSYMASHEKKDDWYYPFADSLQSETFYDAISGKRFSAADGDEKLCGYGEVLFYADGDEKWYEHDQEMIAVSVAFPELLFTLHGIGDDPEDLWMCYYKSGKLQFSQAEIVYDDYDENRLVSPVFEEE